MELVFPFKNISTNSLVEFTDDRENIYDFILIKKKEYLFSEDYFQNKVERFKDTLPNFENEILQIINTTNQSTIDAYFEELKDDFISIKTRISLEEMTSRVTKWNEVVWSC